MKAHRFRILRVTRSGARIDVPRPAWGSDSTFVYATSEAAAIAQAKAGGGVTGGNLIAVRVDEQDRFVSVA